MIFKPLTKEQKLEILSKSIDAGAHIDINFHPHLFETAPVHELETIFADMPCKPSARTRDQSRWIKYQNGEDHDFNGVIFLPQIEPLPKEWQDTGDMEEANV